MPRTAMFAGAVVLALIGLASGLGRAYRASLPLPGTPEAATRAAAADSVYFGLMTGSSLVSLGEARTRELHADFIDLQHKYDRHPLATLAHTGLGALFMMLAPLQLVRRVRTRYPVVHRWSGRILLTLGLVIAASAMYIVWRAPHGGAPETLLITTIAAWFLISGGRAWRAIRRGDVARHREWMLRFLAGALAISMVRIVSLPMALLITGISLRANAVLAMAVGWAITLPIAEWWIRKPRQIEAEEGSVIQQGSVAV